MVFLHSGARDFDLGGGFQHSGNYPMVFLHSGARDFDLGGGFQYSGNYPMVFLHSGARPRSVLLLLAAMLATQHTDFESFTAGRSSHLTSGN
jgi:hypothetical protein